MAEQACDMKKYYYCVNTFIDNEPVQLDGHIDATSKEDVVQKLINDGVIDFRGYEFLKLDSEG